MSFEELLPIIGENIKKRRINILKTKRELADLCEITPSYLEKIEDGQRQVTLKVLMKIGEHLYMKDWRRLLYEDE